MTDLPRRLFLSGAASAATRRISNPQPKATPMHETMDAKDSPKRIWVKFAKTSLTSNPLHIRMWQQEPFVGAAEYVQVEEAAIDRFDSAAIMWSLDGAPLKPSPDGMWVRFADVQRLIDASLKSRGA